jgi:D-alanyl-D-alanine carboxypeptidase
MDNRALSADLEPLVEGLLNAAGAPGATVALSVDGEVWSAGIGHADADRAVPLLADARFGIYSITKTVIATIVLGMAEDRMLALDDPIGQYLPDLSFDTRVSIRQLLNHTGGMPDYGPDPAYQQAVHERPGTPWSGEEFVRRTLGNGLAYMPGHGWRYSNIGYLLLRQVLEGESGLPFRHLVRHFLVRPAGLGDLAVADGMGDMALLTPGYGAAPDNGALVNVTAGYHPGWVSHGLVTATASGLVRFLDLLFEGDLMGPASLDAMMIPVPVTTSHQWMSSPSYGLGLMMDPANRFGTVAGHSGGGPGYSTAAYRFPDVHGHRVTAVTLVNRDGADTATDIVFTMVERLAADLDGKP